jgi:acyl carrier protein
MAIIDEVKSVLKEALQLEGKIDSFDSDTPILGSIPEFDSMTVVAVITALEEKYGFEVEDDEIAGETFETLGSLTEFVRQKLEDN